MIALNWTREPSRGQHGVYLTHDGIHYNAFSLRDNREEEGKQNEESNNREGLNKTQQRRTKEHDAQSTQNTPLEEDTHEEGGEFRVTNTPARVYRTASPQKNIHGDGGEIQTTKATSRKCKQ